MRVYQSTWNENRTMEKITCLLALALYQRVSQSFTFLVSCVKQVRGSVRQGTSSWTSRKSHLESLQARFNCLSSEKTKPSDLVGAYGHYNVVKTCKKRKEKIIEIRPMEIWKACTVFWWVNFFSKCETSRFVLQNVLGNLKKKTVLSFSLKCDFKRFVKCKEFCGFILFS